MTNLIHSPRQGYPRFLAAAQRDAVFTNFRHVSVRKRCEVVSQRAALDNFVESGDVIILPPTNVVSARERRGR